MRRLVLLTMIALLLVGTFVGCGTTAQSREMRDARRAFNAQQFAEARTLILAAEDPYTVNDPAYWLLRAQIESARFDFQVANAMMGRAVNEAEMFNSLYYSYIAFVRADSLAQIPDDRGRVRNDVRRHAIGPLRINHPHFINGGSFFSRQNNPGRAADMFEMFWNIPTLPMFEGTRYAFDQVDEQDAISAKYFAIVSALQADQYRRAIGMMERLLSEEFIENDSFTLSELYELKVVTFQTLEDDAGAAAALRVGFERFPENEFFSRNFIGYLIENERGEEAFDYIDRAVAANPTLACELLSAKAAMILIQGDEERAINELRILLGMSPNCEPALETLARSYILRAQDLNMESFALSTRAERIAFDEEHILPLYLAALSLLENLDRLRLARSAPQFEQNAILFLLHNVYYNLSGFGLDKNAEIAAVVARMPEDFFED